MTEKRFKIIDKEFISYYGGYGHLISNGNCKFWLWHDESGSQKVCDKLNIIMEENEQLKQEKEFWKGDACKYSSYLSILSMDCQIVQEAIWDLKRVIDVDTEASKLLDELDDKFDELNQHRIRCMR